MQQAFVEFANKVPFYGAVVACVDDPHLRAVLPQMTRRVTTYGLSEAAQMPDITATGIVAITIGRARRMREGRLGIDERRRSSALTSVSAGGAPLASRFRSLVADSGAAGSVVRANARVETAASSATGVRV